MTPDKPTEPSPEPSPMGPALVPVIPPPPPVPNIRLDFEAGRNTHHGTHYTLPNKKR